MEFKVYHKSDVGLRKNNEDSYWVLHYKAKDNQGTAVEGAIICVCDGMGALAGGEVASSTTIAELRNNIVNSKGFTDEDIILAIRRANSKLYTIGVEKYNEAKNSGSTEAEARRYMLGTTCTLLILEEGTYRVFHVGDSRCYRILPNDQYMALTTDHTAFEKYRNTMKKLPDGTVSVNGKVKTVKEVARMASSLTKSVGTALDIDVDVIRGNYNKGDMFLVSSDGFWHELVSKRDRLHQQWVPLLKKDVNSTLDTLCELFKSRGEKDNLTVTVVHAI